MSNANGINNKQVQRGTLGNGRSWRSRGRGQPEARGLPLKGRTPIPQTTTGGHTQQSEAKPPTASPSDAQTTRRRMNLMASVSRSSGLQKDGDE